MHQHHIRHHRILVAIETDPLRYHGEHAARPARAGRSGAEQLLAHVAADLAEQLPGAHRCMLTMPGALYDQTQLLQPGYPLFQALESLAESSLAGRDFEPRLLSFGSDSEGRMPAPALEPARDVPPALLQVLPAVMSAPGELLAPLAEASEHRFMETGQLSPQSAKALEAQFGIGVTHARLMTLTDLLAMLRLQLEHFGFPGLWTLLDSALEAAEPVEVRTDRGHRFNYRDGSVTGEFQTFDHWARDGAGRDVPAERLALAAAYADWTREFRQFLTTLSAHGVPFRSEVQASPGGDLHDGWYSEVTDHAAAPAAASVTGHSAGELGTVAITEVRDGRLVHHYPLGPDGLNAIHAALGAGGQAKGAVAWPGGICHDPVERRLLPDLVTGEAVQ